MAPARSEKTSRRAGSTRKEIGDELRTVRRTQDVEGDGLQVCRGGVHAPHPGVRRARDVHPRDPQESRRERPRRGLDPRTVRRPRRGLPRQRHHHRGALPRGHGDRPQRDRGPLRLRGDLPERHGGAEAEVSSPRLQGRVGRRGGLHGAQRGNRRGGLQDARRPRRQ